jgi:hypothetical protein
MQTAYAVCLLFDPEDGDSMFLSNITSVDVHERGTDKSLAL